MHILVAEPIHPDGLEWLRAHGATVLLGYAGDDWHAHADEIRAIVVRSLRVDGPLLDQLPALEVVGKHGVGVNTIDLDATASRGVKVTNVQGANANSVAEGAVALLLAALRDLVACDRATRAGEWTDFRSGLRFMKELRGARLGILGAGRIGRRVAEIGYHGFGCEIGIYDPYAALGALADLGATSFAGVAELFDWSEHVVVAAPLTPRSQGLVGADALSRLGPDGVVVVCSRGGIVDEAAMAEAIRAGRVRGGALDSYHPEPAKDNPLFGLDEMVLTPHVGGHSDVSRRRLTMTVLEQTWSLLHGADAPLAGGVKELVAADETGDYHASCTM